MLDHKYLERSSCMLAKTLITRPCWGS